MGGGGTRSPGIRDREAQSVALTVAQPLKAFQGSALYLDTVILVRFMDAESPWHAACRQLLYRAIDHAHPIRLVMATLTIDETIFVSLGELVQRPPYGVTRSRGQYLRADPEVVQELMASVDSWVQNWLGVLSLEPVLPEDISAMRGVMKATGLLPRDAIHLSVARRLGIAAIASNDDDFERAADVILFKP
jgi:predicted nucleic acid-binding protein